MLLLFLLSGSMAIYVLSDPSLAQANKLAAVALQVDRLYSGELDWEKMFQSGRNAMFDKLDRYSGYLSKDYLARLREELSGGYGGIGVSVLEHDDGLLVTSVRASSPAYAAGFLAGDIIVRADSFALAGMSINDASRLLRGESGTSIDVELYRPTDADTILATLERARVTLLHVPFAGVTEDSVVYIRLLDFQSGASGDVEAALDSLVSGQNGLQGLILDLRGNPGGLFREGHDLASLFLESGQFIVGKDGNSRWQESEHYASGTDLAESLPMAVLVDGGTASSAEIVAGALRQAGRAILIGDTTFGKGLVQSFTRFPDGSGLRLTSSRYYLDSGLFINPPESSAVQTGQGLVPDLYLDYVGQHEFPRALERSLLLTQFAYLHQDEIIAIPISFALGTEWIDRFETFATENSLNFVSTCSEAASDLVQTANLEEQNSGTIAQAERIEKLSRELDRQQFKRYRQYIGMRLRQLSYERKYSEFVAFRDVLIHESEDIQMASRLLKEKVRDE